MNVVDRGCKPYDDATVNGGDEVVPRIVEKLGGHARVNGIVEDRRGLLQPERQRPQAGVS